MRTASVEVASSWSASSDSARSSARTRAVVGSSGDTRVHSRRAIDPVAVGSSRASTGGSALTIVAMMVPARAATDAGRRSLRSGSVERSAATVTRSRSGSGVSAGSAACTRRATASSARSELQCSFGPMVAPQSHAATSSYRALVAAGVTSHPRYARWPAGSSGVTAWSITISGAPLARPGSPVLGQPFDVGARVAAGPAAGRPLPAHQPAAHVGVERLRLHPEAGRRLRGGEPALVAHLAIILISNQR